MTRREIDGLLPAASTKQLSAIRIVALFMLDLSLFLLPETGDTKSRSADSQIVTISLAAVPTTAETNPDFLQKCGQATDSRR